MSVELPIVELRTAISADVKYIRSLRHENRRLKAEIQQWKRLYEDLKADTGIQFSLLQNRIHDQLQQFQEHWNLIHRYFDNECPSADSSDNETVVYLTDDEELDAF